MELTALSSPQAIGGGSRLHSVRTYLGHPYTRYLSFHVLAAWGKDRVDRIRECAPHLLVAALCDRLCKVGMGLKFAARRVQHTSDFKMTRPSQLHPMHSTRSAALVHTPNPVCKAPPTP